MKTTTVGAKCDCGTKAAAKVWCHIHGYLVKPSTVKQPKGKK